MTRLLLAVLTLCAMYVGASAQTFDARFPDLTFQDSECTRTIPVALCYPTTDTAQSVRYAGVHTGQAARGGAFAPGRLPLVILSHGTRGNRFNQFHFGETLARNGYIVATIEYPCDRTFDHGDFGTAKNLYNRPRDMSFAIDALHADSDLRELIDGARIAAFGHSAGGYTAIAAAGGRPHIERLMDYCRKIPGKRMT